MEALYINISYLVSKVRTLERDNEISTNKYNRQIKEYENRIEGFENIIKELPCPERVKKMKIVNRDLEEGVQILHKEIKSHKDRIKELESLEIFNINDISDPTPEQVREMHESIILSDEANREEQEAYDAHMLRQIDMERKEHE